jgi:O-antigen ligase
MKTIVFYLERLWVWVLYALMLFPILPRGIESVLMIGLFVISVFLWFKKQQTAPPYKDRKTIFFVFLFSTIFFVYIISLIYTDNIQEAVNRIIKILPIILFPIVFLFLCKDNVAKLKLKTLHNIYLLALTIGVLFLHFHFLNELHFSDNSHWEIRKKIEELTDIHGTYITIYLGLGVFLLLVDIETKWNSFKLKTKILQFILVGYFIFWQITIGARTPFLMTLCVGLLYFVIKSKINKKTILYFSLLSVFTFLFLVISKSNIIERVKTVVDFEQSFPKGDYSKEYKNITPEDIRKGIYYCSWNLAKDSFWYGYGIGDVQNQLDVCYKEEFKTNTYQMFNFNSHNQYLQVLLSSGIFALILFLLSLLIPIYLSLKRNNYLWFLFTLFMMLCFITENVIDRHDGVIYYSLFNSILMIKRLKKNEKSINS